jgi:fibro-slime domain-containing protein
MHLENAMTRAVPRIAIVAALLWAPAAWAQLPPTLTLTGTVRDFTAAHPDFEGPISGLVTGLVGSTLAPGGVPTFVGSPGAGSITDATTFDQWFKNVPGVNMAAPLSITLTLSDPATGTYSYSNPEFFPIDGALLGNEGNAHNYHFTYAIYGTFGYTAGVGQSFAFTGDDDVWVYLNNRLAIDLGGVHGAVSGSVDLDAFAPTSGMTSGNNYPFAFFFAERHLTESHFTIETSLPLVPVPEPSTYALLAAGLATLVLRQIAPRLAERTRC